MAGRFLWLNATRVLAHPSKLCITYTLGYQFDLLTNHYNHENKNLETHAAPADFG
jgi:hypothetical protein